MGRLLIPRRYRGAEADGTHTNHDIASLSLWVTAREWGRVS
jgi:hypothetical protein